VPDAVLDEWDAASYPAEILRNFQDPELEGEDKMSYMAVFRLLELMGMERRVFVQAFTGGPEEGDEMDDADAERLVEAFLEAVVQPVREGRRLSFRCDICNRTMRSEEAAVKHALEQHEAELHDFLEAHMELGPPDMMGGMPGMMGGMSPCFGANGTGCNAVMAAFMNRMQMMNSAGQDQSAA